MKRLSLLRKLHRVPALPQEGSAYQSSAWREKVLHCECVAAVFQAGMLRLSTEFMESEGEAQTKVSIAYRAWNGGIAKARSESVGTSQ
jgi:hypothetical protein